MDTLFWIQCNPNIKIEHTTKKYFGRFLYKLVVYCPAGRLIDSKGEMSSQLKHRRDMHKHINQSGWWGSHRHKDLDHANVVLLDVMRELRRNSRLDGIRLRVEEPRIQVYATSEQELKNLISDQLKPFVTEIEIVAGPANDQCENLLNSGAIIRKTDIGYSHKVILRDGRYSVEVKNNILRYLEQLDVSVAKVPTSGYQTLKNTNGFIWSLYFYTNDPSVVTFLELIQPGLVLNIHELVLAPHK